MTMLELTKENFEQEVQNASLPVVVDFWAPWCGYCRMLSPLLDQIAASYEGKLLFGKINIDEQPELAQRFDVMTIPTLLLFRDGTSGEPSVAAKSKHQIEQWLQAQGIQ